MSSYLFASASSHRIADGTTYTPGTAHTLAALVRVPSLPGAGVYPTVHAQNSGTAARVVALQLNGDNGGSVACMVGATRMSPSTQIVPPTDTWVIIGASKASGTVAVDFFMYNCETCQWTEYASAGTVVNRTSSAVSPNVGSNGAANYWEGHIAATLGLGRGLQQGDWRRLAHGAHEWRNLVQHTRTTASNAIINVQQYIDLTSPRGVAICLNQKLNLYATGAAPTLDMATPPGW